jgi:hypothetical protein
MNDDVAGDISSRVESGDGPTYPAPLYRRLAALVGSEGIVHVEVALEGLDTLNGQALVFTTNRVVHARVEGLPGAGPPQDTSAITVTTWARSALIAVSMSPSETGRWNTDPEWERPEWPVNARVELDYGPFGIWGLPMKDYPQQGVRHALRDLLPQLLDDVTRRHLGP